MLNAEQKIALGYSVDDLVIYCTFDSENCDDDFWTFYHTTYGNCYTFNSGKTTLRKSSLAGPRNGKKLSNIISGINVG